jgi:glycosyltransferase involved in cell wall biosynthesis
VIIVDNNSSDHTIEVAKRHPIKTIVNIERFFPGKAINDGIRASTGNYIVCISAHCVPKDRQWLQNLYKNFDRKKKYKSKVVVNYLDGTKCNFKAKIRAHGDLIDHIELVDGVPVSSLRVNLQEGNIENRTKFILLRPKSRNSDNEIFVSTLFSHLGFLSPKSFYIDVKIHGRTVKYIFQENLKKEFLEINKRVEGPIIEKNEDLWTHGNILQMTRVSNKEWIKSEKSNLLTTIEALQKHNKILMNSYNYTVNFRGDAIKSSCIPTSILVKTPSGPWLY